MSSTIVILTIVHSFMTYLPGTFSDVDGIDGSTTTLTFETMNECVDYADNARMIAANWWDNSIKNEDTWWQIGDDIIEDDYSQLRLYVNNYEAERDITWQVAYSQYNCEVFYNG